MRRVDGVGRYPPRMTADPQHLGLLARLLLLLRCLLWRHLYSLWRWLRLLSLLCLWRWRWLRLTLSLLCRLLLRLGLWLLRLGLSLLLLW